MVVHIVNGLPDNTWWLVFRCQSKDDDLGYHQLLVGQEYYWKFRVNFFRTTLFFCHFYWENKDKIFNVFKASTAFPDCSPVHDDPPRCFWLVKDDGFYFSKKMVDPNSLDWEKLYSCPGADDTPRCYWLVKDDGFYYSNEMADPNSLDWKKLYSCINYFVIA
ncbi:hypothetical protein LguiA_030405 [Lonicera macranthoides]